MDYTNIITESKWQILKELAGKEMTPTDLALKTKTSLANMSQQLRLLEAYGIVKKERQEKTELGPGKPRTNYTINKDIISLTIITKNEAIRKNLEPDFIQKTIIRILAQEGNENAFYIQKFLLGTTEVTSNCDYIGIISKKNDAIDLLLITTEVKLIREKYSNQEITNLENKKKRINCWTHDMKEIEEGIKNNNEYFKNLVQNSKMIMDMTGLSAKLKELKK